MSHAWVGSYCGEREHVKMQYLPERIHNPEIYMYIDTRTFQVCSPSTVLNPINISQCPPPPLPTPPATTFLQAGTQSGTKPFPDPLQSPASLCQACEVQKVIWTRARSEELVRNEGAR